MIKVELRFLRKKTELFQEGFYLTGFFAIIKKLVVKFLMDDLDSYVLFKVFVDETHNTRTTAVHCQPARHPAVNQSTTFLLFDREVPLA